MSMSVTTYTTALATAYFAASASALLSPPSSIPQIHFLRRISRGSGEILGYDRSHTQFTLRISFEETFETEGLPVNNETLNESQQEKHSIICSGPTIRADPSRANSSDNDDHDVNSNSSRPQQEQTTQQVLSSPADAINDVNDEIDVNSSPIAGEAVITTVTDCLTTVTAAARSKEDDLELTRRAIMNHIKEGEENDDDDHGPRKESSPLKSTTTVVPSIITPSIPKILRYTVPAIGIWLCSPVLSMIDTAAVGLLSGTAQQAALNPAVSVTDYGALVVAFMYTATTNLIAAAVQEDKDDNHANANGSNNTKISRPKTTTTLLTALKLALLVGSTFGIFLTLSSELLLRLLIGNDSLDPTVYSAALRYVRIRALGMPAMVVIGTAQSACLGMQDVKSPLYILLAAAVVNFVGDVVLVPRVGSKVFGGAAGAAWATVASQYAALAFFARWVTTTTATTTTRVTAKDDDDSLLDNSSTLDSTTQGTTTTELGGKSSEAGRSRRKKFRKLLASSKLSRKIRLARTTSMYESLESYLPASMMSAITTNKYNKRIKLPPATRGFLSDGKLTPRNYLSFSERHFDRTKANEFSPFVIPVTTTSVGRISGYLAMSHVASSTLGTHDMAAHQIVFSIFCCLIPFVDALSQVAQSFVPAVFEARGSSRRGHDGKERAKALRETVGNFRKVGVGFGGVLVGLVACIPLIGRYFTTDPIVLERMNGALPGVGLFLLVNGLMCAGEGTLLGQKDLKFLRNMYAIFFFTVPAYMLRLKHRALTGAQTVGIGTMWAAFSTYNLIRTASWHLRLAQLQRRTERGVVAAGSGGEEER